MFDPEFYPTPPNVISEMIQGENLTDKTILEPSAGAGAIIDVLRSQGVKSILACELNPDLSEIVKGKADKFLTADFFSVKREDISHINYIVMNPPFSNADKHILHAFSVAPDGCRVIALCNSQTIENPFTKQREELAALIGKYGEAVCLGSVFEDADRKTNADVTLIKLQKPSDPYRVEFDGFLMDDEPEKETGEGLMSYNFVRDVVNRYIAAVKLYDKQINLGVEMNNLTRSFFSGSLAMSLSVDQIPTKRTEFKKDLQRSAWKYLIGKFNLNKHTTEELREEINRFVEDQTQIPFTMANVYHMFAVINQTTGQRMDKAIIGMFEKVAGHTKENQQRVEGWAHNSDYLLTEHFIVPGYVEISWSGSPSISYNSAERLNDFIKTVCYATGKDFDNYPNIDDFVRNEVHCKLSDGRYLAKHSRKYGSYEAEIKAAHEKGVTAEVFTTDIVFGQWINFCSLFNIRLYKKGTIHFKWSSLDDWATYNQRIAKIKGLALPRKTQKAKPEQKGSYQHKSTYAPKPQNAPVNAKVLFSVKM